MVHAAAKAAEPNDVAEARKLQDSAQHAAKRAAAPAEVTEARKLQDSAQHAAKRAREKAAKIKAVADALKKQRAEENAARNRKLHESLSEEGENLAVLDRGQVNGKFHKPFGIWINKFEFFLIRTSGSWRPFDS